MINKAADKKPRNVCDMHKLCNFVNQKGKLCSKIAFKFSLYCGEHQERKDQSSFRSRKCFGTNTKGKPCENNQSEYFKIDGKSYCNFHIPPISDSSDEDYTKKNH